MSPLCFELTACPLPSLGCLHSPTFFRRLCVDHLSLCRDRVNCLSSCQLDINCIWKHRVPLQSRVPCNHKQCVYYPPSYRLLHFLLSLYRLLDCVDYLSSRRLLVDVNYSLYQHPSEIQCSVQSIINERVTDRGYLGDVGRHTVMRFGTVDPKRPAVAILAMHPRSLDSSWRG